ncbi:MAG: hypothetical protein ACYS26_20390 [Planctomycetota bacterium]
MSQGYTLMISPSLMNEIAYLHSKNDNKEWCGMLFYEEVSGSLFNSDLVLRAKHIYLLDIGSSAYTAGSVDMELLDFFEEVPEAEDMRRGFIHTHHNMRAYFSSTDMSELYDNTKHYDYYLSLIVNHATLFVTKIGMEAEIGVTGTTLKVDNPPILTFDGKVEYDIPVNLAARQFKLSKPVVQGYQTPNQLYRDTPFEEHISPNQMNIFDVPGVEPEFDIREEKMFSINAFSAVRKMIGLTVDKEFTTQNIFEVLKPLENMSDDMKIQIIDTEIENQLAIVLQEEYGTQEEDMYLGSNEIYNLMMEYFPEDKDLKEYPFVQELVHTMFEEVAVLTIDTVR